MKRPFIIAGPCSAESREQVLETASQLQGLGVDVLRAGVWKQRTRPGTFEGAGAVALPWLREAGERYGLRTGCEVFTPEQLRQAVSAGVDVLWIGARAVANPVIVQGLADELKAVLGETVVAADSADAVAPADTAVEAVSPVEAGDGDASATAETVSPCAAVLGASKPLTILLKNPPSPDLDLWAGAFERFLAIQDTRSQQTQTHCRPRFALGAILRGVTPYLPGCPYRNDPAWQMGLDLRERFPGMPLYFDPSHVAGDAALVQGLARRAIAVGFDGLMVEVHSNPAAALSDAPQQLTPAAFSALLASLPEASENSLGRYREEIDILDGQLIALLGHRMALSAQIGKLKADNAIAPLQSARWEKVLEHAIAAGASAGLSEAFVREIFDKIHAESLRRQQ